MQKVIVTASGSGERMGGGIPKQFLIINNKPVLFYTIEQFYKYSSEIEIILTLNENYISYWNDLVTKYNFKFKHRVVVGGSTRFESVKNAINTIEEKGLVAIHDAVRPFVSIDTIKRCFDVAEKKGNAVPYVEMTDSIRRIDNDTNISVNRRNYVKVQTPQVFDIDLIKKAYQDAGNAEYTDDASVLENINQQIFLIKGNIENFKITTKYDLKLSEFYLNDLNKIEV